IERSKPLVRGIAISHPDRVMYERPRLTKLDVVRPAAAAHQLEGHRGAAQPHLVGRTFRSACLRRALAGLKTRPTPRRPEGLRYTLQVHYPPSASGDGNPCCARPTSPSCFAVVLYNSNRPSAAIGAMRWRSLSICVADMAVKSDAIRTFC